MHIARLTSLASMATVEGYVSWLAVTMTVNIQEWSHEDSAARRVDTLGYISPCELPHTHRLQRPQKNARAWVFLD